MGKIFIFAFTQALILCSSQEHGYADCPCITPSVQNWCDSNHRAMYGGQCYPSTFGAGSCAAHDEEVTQECVSDSTSCRTVGGASIECEQSKTWCTSKFCWVNPNDCGVPYAASEFFPNSSLYYSYETCGNMNDYGSNRFVTFLKSLGPLRISFPGKSVTGYTVVEDGPPGYQGANVNTGTNRKFGEFGRMGSTVEFFDAVWKDLGRTEFTVVAVSQASQERYPQSLFSACVHDIALHRTDACVGNFWTTTDRRLQADFTAPIYEDTFHLVVNASLQDNVWVDYLDRPLQLFGWHWLLIVLFLVYASLVLWMIEGATNEQDFPERGSLDGFLRSLFLHFQCFLGGGDHRTNPHSFAGRLVVLCTSIVVLFIVTLFTAKMTMEGIDKSLVTGTFKNIDAVLQEKGRICGMQANQKDFLLRHPKVSGFYEAVETDSEGLAGMNSGRCKAAVLRSDSWHLQKKLKGNCDKVLLPEVLFSKAEAYPMRADLVAPFSWAMTKLQAAGVYEQLREKAMRRYLDTPDSCVAAQGDPEDSKKNDGLLNAYIDAPILLFSIVITVIMVVVIIREVVNRRQADGPDGIFRIRSLRQRFGWVSSNAKEAYTTSAQSLEEVTRGQRNLKMIRKVFEARHLAEVAIHKRIKADAPITVSDIPMLVYLLKEEVKMDLNSAVLSKRDSPITSLSTGQPEETAPDISLEQEPAPTVSLEQELEQK